MRYAIRFGGDEEGDRREEKKNGRQTELRKPVKDNKLKAKLIIRDVSSRSNIRTSAKFNLSKENRNKTRCDVCRYLQFVFDQKPTYYV